MALPFEIPADLSGFSAEDLDSYEGQALAAAATYQTVQPADVTPEVIAEVRALRDFIAAIGTQRTANAEAAAQAAQEAEQRQADFAAELAALPTAPAAPAAAPAPAAEAVAATAQATVDGRAYSTTVTPAGTPRPRSSVAAAAARATNTAEAVTPENPFSQWIIPADSGVASFADWSEVATVAERRFAGYRGLPSGSRNTVALIQRNFPKELLATDDKSDDTLISYATSEKRLTGNSVVAAAGWCAPSTTIYDLCEMETADGMIDVPEVQITRGGLRFTPGPDFASIFNGSGYFHQTETQVIANTVKPCMEIPCPPFQDIRLEVEGLCITGSILQRRGYPELVERFIRGALIAHMHKLNAFVIAQMATIGAGASALVDYSAGGPLGDNSVTGLLHAIEIQVEDTRYRNRMGLNSTVAVKAPHWLQPQIRSDFSRRVAEGRTNVTDAEIQEHFARRGARLQYVYDWQDAFTGLATGPGGAVPITQLPASVDLLMYPEGTWLRGSDSTIRLDTIYDSTNLSTNRFTALFTEEGVLVAKTCFDSRVIRFPLCPTGATTDPVTRTCA
jgi:hypothetical protein